MFIFYLLGVGLPCQFDFLSVLVVRGGAVRLPTLPSWFSQIILIEPTLCAMHWARDTGLGQMSFCSPRAHILTGERDM